MEKQFQILAEGKPIGSATVTRHGLYYQIHCICHLMERNPCRIYAACDDREIDLGICVPMDGGFGIRTRVPVKRLGEGEIRFWAAAHNEKPQEQFVPVETGRPFIFLSQLKNARLAVRNRKTGILLSDTQSSISRPTGQWSEPNTSE